MKNIKLWHIIVSLGLVIVLMAMLSTNYYRESKELHEANITLKTQVKEHALNVTKLKQSITKLEQENSSLKANTELITVKIENKDGSKITKTHLKKSLEKESNKQAVTQENVNKEQIEAKKAEQNQALNASQKSAKEEIEKKSNNFTWLGFGIAVGSIATCVLTGICTIF